MLRQRAPVESAQPSTMQGSVILIDHGRPQKKMQGGPKHSRDGHLSESYSQVSVSDRVTN